MLIKSGQRWRHNDAAGIHDVWEVKAISADAELVSLVSIDKRRAPQSIAVEQLETCWHPVKIVPCDTYGCTQPKEDWRVFCDECYADYLADPDAYK